MRVLLDSASGLFGSANHGRGAIWNTLTLISSFQSERWLRPYGVFCWLRDFFGTANHEDWGALGTGKVTREKLVQLSSPGSDLYKGVAYHWVVQYWLHLQLREASEYCGAKGVALKGDLPIGIDHDSVDAW